MSRYSGLYTFAAFLLVLSITAAQADEIQARLAQKDFASEAAVRMMIVMAAASGKSGRAACIHDHYFGSPLRLRRTLWRVWRETDANPEAAMLAAFKAICLQEQPAVTASERETWLRAANAAVLLEPDNATPLIAAAEMLASYAADGGDELLARCVREQHTEGQLDKALNDEAPEHPTAPLSLAVYDAYRKLCGLNPNGPAASELALPSTPDIATVARERLMIVQDFRICESTSEAAMKDCVHRAYQTRSKQIYNQLLMSRDN